MSSPPSAFMPTTPPVPVLAKGKTRTGRLWTYVRDDRPFAGPDPPAAVFFYSRDRGGEHPKQHLTGYAGLMQADAYAGFNRLYEADRKGGTTVEAACWAHARRKFFDLARLNQAPIASEVVARIDALFTIEREINGLAPPQRVGVRTERSRPLIIALEAWLREQRARVSKNSDTGKAIAYSLKRSAALTRFLDEGRLCMTNNAAERELRAIAIGRRNWTFAGSDEGGRRAATLYTLIATAKLNDVDPQAWLADVLARLLDNRRNGSATCYRGTGTQNAAPPPDHRFRIETGELIGLPRHALIDLGELIWAAGCPAIFGEHLPHHMDGQKFELDQHRFFTPVFDVDRPVNVRRAHVARADIHQVTILGDQHDGSRSVILDDEVGWHQSLRE